MDILKKMFGLNGGAAAAEKDAAINDKNAKSKVPAFGNDFKKPIWYDEESDDELFDNNKLFGFQVFSDPMEIQKYHEQQLQRMLKTFEEMEGGGTGMFEENFREEYLKPGFEKFDNYGDVKPSVDVDLDGEIYADQLHSLLQRISPALESIKAKQAAKKEEPKRKLTDEEKFMDQIHGIDEDEKRAAAVQPFKKHEFANQPPNMRIPHYGGAFEGVIDGPKTRRQTFSYQMIRKPDGTYTTSTVVDPDGNTKTVIKRTIDGETKTQTLINGVEQNDDKNAVVGSIAGPLTAAAAAAATQAKQNDWIIDCGRHFYVNEAGYALPKNLW